MKNGKKKTKWTVLIYVTKGNLYWLFEKDVPAPPPSPFIGMLINDLDGAGENLCVEEVTWYPHLNEACMKVEDDKWCDAYPYEKTPKEMYVGDGWKVIDEPEENE